MLNFATQIAREAGNLLVQRLGVAKITNKGDINLVTEADIAAENLIIERIRSYYPQHGILAEESGEVTLVGGKRSEWKWIIDPLDGTTNYAHGYPCFCVSIALEHKGELEIGVVYDPMRDEMFAADGRAFGLADNPEEAVVGPPAFKVFHGTFRGAFPDITVTVEDMIAEGDKVAARCSVRGKHQGDHLGIAATNTPVDFTGMQSCVSATARSSKPGTISTS